MEKIWLKSYPEHLQKEIELDKYQSIAELFQESCQKYADHPAYTNFGTTISYKELAVKARNFAAYLTEVLGAEKGDRIAIMLPNVIQYPIAFFGAHLAGLIVVNVNPLYTTRELRHQLQDSGASIIVVIENVAAVLEKVVQETELQHIIISKIGDCLHFPKNLMVNFAIKYIKKKCPAYHLPDAICFNEMMHQGQAFSLSEPKIGPEDIALLQYTGGTTGVAKGAKLTHRNLISNIEQAYCWIHDQVDEGKEIIITALPLYHIFSLTANCLTFLREGALNVLITNPRDIPAFIKELKRHRFTVITGVNTLFNVLLNDSQFATCDFSSLKLALGGGMAVHKAVAERWQEVTDSPLAEAYGLTETSPAAMINPLTLTAYNGSIGLPIASTEIKLIDDDGQELPIGESGELCIRGPQVMQGYWQREDETRLVLDGDGWLRTGDVAKVDEQGFVYLIDRKKDMILVSGFNVYPNEIEEIMSEHSGVLEVAAIGIPDELCGEAVKLFVVPKEASLTKDELLKFARQNLTRYKIPKFIEFRDELPKTNVGKILRKALRDEQ